MPIRKNQQIGKHNDVTLLSFGIGDIAVSNGYLEDNEEVKTLVFGQDKPKPVSEYNKEIPITGSDDLENIVMMEFTSTESVDVVMKHLDRLRKDLVQHKQDNCEHRDKQNDICDDCEKELN